MAKNKLITKSMQNVMFMVPYLVHFPSHHFWVDYDKDADVLYISFSRPQNATDSEMDEDGVLYRYQGDQLVGITILDASKRK